LIFRIKSSINNRHMNSRKHLLTLATAAVFALSASVKADVSNVVADMAWAANNFLNALTDEERATASFDLKDDQRIDWHFIPKDRKGLGINKISGEKKTLAQALLSSGLSSRGYLQASTIMTLEKILQDMEGPGRRFPRDPELYHVSIFGKPSNTGTWAWSFEGHHLSVNFTIVKGQEISATPHFMGTNPAHVKEGPRKGLQVLGNEENQARALLKSLRPAQFKKAMIGDKAPGDIFTAAEKTVTPLENKGIAASELNWSQVEDLLGIIETYLYHVRPEVAEIELEQIEKAGIAVIKFAWMGGTEVGDAHYYRIQGPTFLLEYDNIQNGANHVHAVWRDFNGDFGRDLLKRHYEQFPH
jgi:hypothetical protein